MNFLATHIQLFKHTALRANNDLNNKFRELFFTICRIEGNETIFEDPVYGSDCVDIRTKFETKLKELGDYDSYTIKQMAGRKYNYDFLLEFEKDGEKKEIKLEFKFNANSIVSIPQFIQKNTTWELFGEKYHDHFYNGSYLREIIALNDDVSTPAAVPIPPKEEYMKYIMNTKYSCHPFFQYLKDTEESKKAEKHAIVKRSIGDYLGKYAQCIHIDVFKQTIIETQSNKEYLLYHPKTCEFYLDRMDMMDLETLVFNRVERKNTIVLKTEKNEYHLLLRWKNHQGILNCAWQVSIRQHKKVKAPKEPKVKVPKEPKVKVPKEPKVKVPKEPKVKAPKEPKVKVPKEPKVKVPKEPKVKVPKDKEPKPKTK
jgi:hypothetical protein